MTRALVSIVKQKENYFFRYSQNFNSGSILQLKVTLFEIKNYASFEIWPNMLALTRLAILLNGFQNFGMNVDKITPLIIEFYHNEDSS